MTDNKAPELKPCPVAKCGTKITPELLRGLLRYDHKTGKLYWKTRDRSLFNDNASHMSWNARCSGKPAFRAKKHTGYLSGAVLDRRIHAHRVAWAIYHNEWPRGQIDHINGNRSDNRLVNLRDVSQSVNGKNQRMSKANKSGFTGVFWCRRDQKWVAQITANKKYYYLGAFTKIEDAVSARIAAQIKHGFHKNHGLRALAGEKKDA